MGNCLDVHVAFLKIKKGEADVWQEGKETDSWANIQFAALRAGVHGGEGW